MMDDPKDPAFNDYSERMHDEYKRDVAKGPGKTTTLVLGIAFAAVIVGVIFFALVNVVFPPEEGISKGFISIDVFPSEFELHPGEGAEVILTVTPKESFEWDYVEPIIKYEGDFEYIQENMYVRTSHKLIPIEEKVPTDEAILFIALEDAELGTYNFQIGIKDEVNEFPHGAKNFYTPLTISIIEKQVDANSSDTELK